MSLGKKNNQFALCNILVELFRQKMAFTNVWVTLLESNEEFDIWY